MSDNESDDVETVTQVVYEDNASAGESLSHHEGDEEDSTHASILTRSTTPHFEDDAHEDQPSSTINIHFEGQEGEEDIPVAVHAADDDDDDCGSVVAAVVVEDDEVNDDSAEAEAVQVTTGPPPKKRSSTGNTAKKKPTKKKKAAHKKSDVQVSTDRLVAASDAREVLEQAVPRLPVLISDTHVVRSFGQLQLENSADHPQFSSASALYPVGFSCDRYEFSPIHGRVLKMRCSIFDGSKVKAKQAQVDTSIPDGPVFRVMWGQGVDADADTVDYPYDPFTMSAYVGPDKIDAVAVTPAGRETDEVIPEEGMRVKVRFDHDEWHTGTIVDVGEEEEWDSKKRMTLFDIRVAYDGGHAEDTVFPSPDIALHLPGSEDEASNEGVIELTAIRGKPVTSVIGASPIEAWGKALVQLGLIDEIMLEIALAAVVSSREEGLAEAKEKLETQKQLRQQARAKTQQKPVTKDKEVSADMGENNDAPKEIEDTSTTETNLPPTREPEMGMDAEIPVDAAHLPLPTQNGAQHVDDTMQAVDTSTGEPSIVETEPPTEQEKRLREKMAFLRERLASAQADDREAQASLADNRISALGPLLHNPFGDADTSTLMTWMATVVRKEKSKMGSTGNKKKIVTVTDLLERNNTFFNGDIEALVEGLPGSEFCQSYVFGALRVGGAAAISQAWVHEAKIRQERDRDRKRQSASAARAKASQNHEKELKRKRRDEERDQRKKQKLEEEEQKKQVRADERLSRLRIQIDDRLSKEATFQREKVVQLLGKTLAKEFARRRKAAELVARQLAPDEQFRTHAATVGRDTSDLPLLNRTYDEDVVRLWDFLSSFGTSFLEWGYLDRIPTLDSLQDAIDVTRGDYVDGTSKSDALDLLVGVSVALCQPLGASLTKLLFASLIALNPTLQKDFGAAFFAEVNATTNSKGATGGVHLPVNVLTWQEIARVVFLSDALIELGYSRTEASHVLRGYRSGGHPNSKEAKRLRRAEDFALSVLRQHIDQARFSSPQGLLAADAERKICVQVPSSPSSTPSDWTFWLHSVKLLPSRSIERAKECLRKAMEILKSKEGTSSTMLIADLDRSLSLFDLASTGDSSSLDQARNLALQVLDRATGETYSSNTVGHVVRQDKISGNEQPRCASATEASLGLQRQRIGHTKSIELVSSEYRQLVHDKEEYMADALQIKEEMDRKANPDDEDEGSDDEDEDDDRGSQKEINDSSGKPDAAASKADAQPQHTEKQLEELNTDEEEKKASEEPSPKASLTALENGPPPSSTDSPGTVRIGKPTPCDEFCADIPSAPELIRRCLAVLRTLCLSSPAEPFLYPVDPQMNPGYYESLLRPMCLREAGLRLQKAAELHSELTESAKKVEAVVAQFGRNIRLIAKNCSGYGNAGPAIIGAGEELLRIFERLFLDWVLAPEELLPPLERLDDDKCVEYHESDEDCMVLLCDGCEGKYNMSRLDPPLEKVPKGDWFCPRCLSGHCWEDLDPRVGKRVAYLQRTLDVNDGTVEPTVGIVAGCKFRYAELPDAGASLVYSVKFDNQIEEAWSLEQVDGALAKEGIAVAPIRCLEAVAESPGFGLGIDRGLYTDLVPVQLNPSVTEMPSQAWLSSSVFRDTISASIALLLLSPEEMTASEWLRLLVLLITKCSSSEIMQALASKKESEAAEEESTKPSHRRKIQDVRELLPIVSDSDLDDAADPESLQIDKTVAAIAKSQAEASDETATMEQPSEVIEAAEIEVVVDTEEAPVAVASAAEAKLSDLEVSALKPTTVAHRSKRDEARAESRKRQRTREDSIGAYCIKNQLRPIVAAFEADMVSRVIDSVLQAGQSGLSFSASRCREVLCDFCGLSDTALGTPLVRVPNKKEWDELMPYASRSRKCFVLADVGKFGGLDEPNNSSKLVLVKIKVDGDLVSRSDEIGGAMTEFLPRNEKGFQDELMFRYNSGIPLVTGSLSAHECCAISAHDSRIDLVIQKHIERERALAEQEAGITCGRTLAVCRDETGRSYWKFNVSSSLFVCTDMTGIATADLHNKSWYRYSAPEEIACLMFSLGHDPAVNDLKRAFPVSSRMLRSRKWTELLQKRRFPIIHADFSPSTVLNSAEQKMPEAQREVDVEIVGQEDGNSEDEPYEEGEHVLVESRNEKLLWDAVVVGVAMSNEGKVAGYRVHYKEWSSRFDEWVGPHRVVEPSENNIEVQEEMRVELLSLPPSIPAPLEHMAAKAFLKAENRIRDRNAIPNFAAVAKVGRSASSEEVAFGVLKAALLMIDAALPIGAMDVSDSGTWAVERAALWRALVQNAAGPSSLMLCAILLEDSLNAEYMDTQYIHLLSCMPLHWKAVKEVSVASLALRILLIDQGIKYGG